MKRFALVLLFLVLVVFAQAQSNQWRVGYFSSVPNPFGAKLSLDIPLYNPDEAKASTGKPHNWRFQPGMATSIRPRFQSNFLVSGAIGWRTNKPDSRRYFGIYYDASYMARAEVMNIQVSLNGSGTSKQREFRGYVLQGLHIEFGQLLTEQVWLYQRPAMAMRFSTIQETAAILFLEVGLQINLSKD